MGRRAKAAPPSPPSLAPVGRAALLAAVEARAAENPDLVVAVVGPTASGKTALALELAERLGGEVVNVDSVQIYTHFDIGSGKPTAHELARARHHFVSERHPLSVIDAAEFAEVAQGRMQAIRQAHRRIILAGGTFLWMKAVLYGLVDAPKACPEVRARHAAIIEENGRGALHAALCQADPTAGARLHENDVLRVSRALEVFELTGRPLSELHADHGFRAPRHPAMLVGTLHSPDELTARIRERIARWLRDGWVDEVRSLRASEIRSARAMGSVGYREINALLDGELAESELAEAIVRATRVFARRQRTWLGHESVHWCSPEVPGAE